MRSSKKLEKIIQTLFFIIFVLFVIALVYMGSIPQRYNLAPGTKSTADISAPRAVKNTKETEKRALESKNAVSPIFVRSDEKSKESINNVTRFFDLCRDIRAGGKAADGTFNQTYQAISDKLIEQTELTFGFTLTSKESFKLITMDDTLLTFLKNQSISISTLILTNKVDDAGLASQISTLTADLSADPNELYVTNPDLVKSLLSHLLRPNAVYDEAATNTARTNAYLTAINNPVTIEKGTRIVSYGEEVTRDIYDILVELNLVNSGNFDTRLMLGIAAYITVVFAVMITYILRFEQSLMQRRRDLLALSLSYVIPIIAAVYLSNISTTIAPVYFSAVIIAIYLGTQSAIVLSTFQILMILPICQFDVEFIFIALLGSIVAAMIAGKRGQKSNSAALILLVALMCLISSLGISLAMKSNITDSLMSILWAVIAGAVSVVAAIGFMPIFELISNTVSPVRLIDLSQPGSPLLKRLFVEAPGTSQHSMMVANLVDSAAEAIGANPLLAKVGAYYHDIGKLEMPLFFTENQQGGVNPHDNLSPEESASIITGHPDQGVRIARRYRLPNNIIRIIQEHHGSTVQAYFYHQAKNFALEKGFPEPNIDNYKYHCPLPSTRESAVVMLADTCEAAMKSTGIRSLTAAEELFRKLIKQKIEQDQLAVSGLSFSDVELIIQAFVQVYAGVLHERIKYPDDSTVH